MGDEAHAPSWSAEGLLQVIDSSLDPLVVSDAQGVIQIASRSAASVFGWEREELVGQSVNILMTGADASQHGAFLAQYRETGVPRIIGRPRTVVGQRRNGEEFPCEICINRVDVPHEPRLHFVAVLRDIALRQRVEDRWRALVDAAPAEILTVGSDLRLRSSGASEEAGAEVRPDEELFAESERQRVRSWIRKALESGEHSSIECRAAGPPADRRISCQIQPLTRRGGSDEAVLVLTDVTELRRAQRALEVMRGVEAVGQMAARVGHQINNPLASIKNASTLLRDAINEDHPHARFLPLIAQEVDRAARTVRQLVDVHSPERACSDELSLHVSLSEVTTMLRAEAEAAGVSLANVQIDADARLTLPHGLLREIVFQLLRNAIDASPRGSRVAIEARVDEFQLRVAVCDHGPGIADEIAARIFEPYFSTRGKEHNGLGLSICRNLASAMGATVNHRPGSPTGTRVELVVPLP